jgi:replicative DNA helicase
MEMTAQELYLYAIIQKKHFKDLKPEYIQLFTDEISSKILECVWLNFMAKEPITVKSITDTISNQPIKDIKKQIYISKLSDICQIDRYMDYDYVQALKDEFFNTRLNQLLNVLVDKKLTPKIKSDKMIEISDEIRKTQTTKDLVTYNQICRQMVTAIDNDVDTDLFSKSIVITDYMLKGIFGERIYPQLQMITARPGDCKTTLMLNLAAHFDDLGRPGLIVSMEDDAEIVAMKLLSIKSGAKKTDIINRKADIKLLKRYQCCKSENIFIMDRQKTLTQLKADIDFLAAIYQIDWIMFDYIQRIKPERGQDRNETVARAADGMLEINKQHKIPVIVLSQVPKEAMVSNKLLGLGDERGAGELAQNSRLSLSLNPSPNNDKTRRLIYRYKTTFDANCQIGVQFEMASGCLDEIRVMDEGVS